MSSFLPPAERNWWSTPVGKQEIIWIGIALIWCLIMFLMMPYWHVYGKQNLSSEAYQTTPEKFQARVDAMVAACAGPRCGGFRAKTLLPQTTSPT